MKDLKTVFEKHIQVKVDKHLIRKIYSFVQNFINTNEEHTEFFGGHLLGVHRAVWVDDVHGVEWLEEVCGVIDMEGLEADINEVPEIEPNWTVSSNPVNLSCLYMAHILHTSKLPQRDKDQAIVYTIITSHIKHLTSGIRRRFRYKANEATAVAHFESLDYRTDLKKYGSWFKLLENRGEQVIGKDFLWKKQLETYQGSYDIMKWANDLQDRLMDVLNALTESFHIVKEQEAKIYSSSRIKEYDGVKEIANVRNQQREIITQLKETVPHTHEFIRESLIADTISIITTGDERFLTSALTYISENHRVIQKLDDVLSKLVIYMFEQAKEEGIKMTDVPALVGKYRNVFRSSRTKNPEVVFIKTYLKQYVEEAIPRARPAMQAATVVALFIYLTLLVFKGKD